MQLQQSHRIQGQSQKAIVFLHTNNEQVSFNLEIKAFTLASQKMKYSDINVAKYKLCMRNTTKLTNKIKELNKCRDIPCSQIGRLYIVKLSLLPNLIYKFNAFSIKYPESYFVLINKLLLKFIWRGKRPRKTNTVLKNTVRGLMLSGLENNYKVTVIEAVWYQ